MKGLFTKSSSLEGDSFLIENEVMPCDKVEEGSNSVHLPAQGKDEIAPPVDSKQPESVEKGTVDSSPSIPIEVTVDSIKDILCGRCVFNQFCVSFLATSIFIFVLNSAPLWTWIQSNLLIVLGAIFVSLIIASAIRLMPNSNRKLAGLLITQVIYFSLNYLFIASICNGSAGFSLHTVTLWGCSQTGIWFFLSVLFQYRLCSHKNFAMFGYAAILPTTVALLAVPYYLSESPKDNLGKLLTLDDFMVNVGAALVLTSFFTLISLLHVQSVVKKATIKKTPGLPLRVQTA